MGKRLIDFFSQYRWEIGGIILLCFVLLMNRFPEGYIIDGADVLQTINLKEQYSFFHYEWMGRVSLFYGFFYLLDLLRISEAGQLSWYLGIFLLGSYFSFLIFCRTVFSNSWRRTGVLISLFYATNLYTLALFTHTWGYTHHPILYIFIPALTGTYIKLLEKRRGLDMLTFFLIVAFASTSFGNPAFALALGIYFLLLTFFLFVCRIARFDLAAVKTLFSVAIISLLLNAYWLFPLIPQIQAGITEVATSEVVNLAERLEKTSNSIFDTIRLLPTSEQRLYYPKNFPYPAWSGIKDYIGILAFLPFLVILLGLRQRFPKQESRLFLTFFTLFAAFIVLVARVRFPFESLNGFLFQLPGFNVLRGYDKLSIFTPFIMSVLLLIVAIQWQEKKRASLYLAGALATIILLALPFYAGGLQTNLSYILAGQKKKDFQEAKLSALVQIPAPYRSVQKYFKELPDDGSKISMLPYSPGSSIGRVQLPVWKVNGPHIAQALYTKKYVEPTNFYIDRWIFAEQFDKPGSDPQWIVDLLGLLGVEHIFYHKDAKPKIVENMEPVRRNLVDAGALRLVEENPFFYLYKMEGERILPYVYTNASPLELENTVEGLSAKIREFRSHARPAPFKKENPKEIMVRLAGEPANSVIFLNEKYDPLWRAAYTSSSGSRQFLERSQNTGFANAWKVPGGLQGNVVLYYQPLMLLRLGMALSAVTLLLVLIFLVYSVKKNKYSNECV